MDDIKNCIICFENEMEMIIFDCNHNICLICYEKMLSMYDTIKCPLCRNIIEAPKIDITNNIIIYPLQNSHNRSRIVYIVGGIIIFILLTLMFVIIFIMILKI
jgi:hypothetical protein